jgi:hypothetical protein
MAEEAYDQGGLPESVALHALWDAVAFLFAALTGTHAFGDTVGLPTVGPAARVGTTPVITPLVSGVF